MNNGITKITYAHDVTLVTLSSLPCDSTAVAGVLTAMSAGNINVDMISQTAPQGGALRLSFSLSDHSLGSALSILGKIRSENPDVKPEILPGNCKVFTLLADAGIQVILVTTSEVDISLLISAHSLTDALAVMSEAYGVEPIQNEF